MPRKKKKEIDEKQIKEWIERGVEKLESLDCGDKKRSKKISGSGGGFWFFGFIGSLIYFWQYVTTFTTAVAAIVKAIFWPAFLVFHILKFLKI